MARGVAYEPGGPSLATLRRWSGMALLVGGAVMPVATAIHPSLETAGTIVDSEMRLVAAHFLITFSYLLVLLGLPGLFGAESVRMGRLGLAGFVVSFTGTFLLAVSGNFGFLAPVWPRERPRQSMPSAATDPSWPSTRWPPLGAWSASSSSGSQCPGHQRCLVTPASLLQWVPPCTLSDLPWPCSSHPLCGPSPSSGALPSASALPGPATECGSAHDPSHLVARRVRARRSSRSSRPHARRRL